MTHTPTLPPDDRGMWRLLVSRSHPDAGGSHELFIGIVAVRNVVCSSRDQDGVKPEPEDHPSHRRDPSTSAAPERVPFDEEAFLEVLIDRAVTMAAAVAEPYGYLLRQVADCFPASEGPLYDQQRCGASYRSLAAIGHMVGMTKAECVQWYSIAEAVPLSQRHAGHILARLKRRTA